MNKDELIKLISKSMPDNISDNIKNDIAKIMANVMEAVVGESTMGIVIALDVLNDFYQFVLDEKTKNIGMDSGTIH